MAVMEIWMADDGSVLTCEDGRREIDFPEGASPEHRIATFEAETVDEILCSRHGAQVRDAFEGLRKTMGREHIAKKHGLLAMARSAAEEAGVWRLRLAALGAVLAPSGLALLPAPPPPPATP